jgi:hypothetical protein
MSWINISNNETAWGTGVQNSIYSVYDWNDVYDISYMTYDGYFDNLTPNFSCPVGVETGWNVQQPLTITDIQAYPIGLLLALTKEVVTVTNYEDTWDNINNNETAWQTI